jgi:inorganic pyrophosphatase
MRIEKLNADQKKETIAIARAALKPLSEEAQTAEKAIEAFFESHIDRYEIIGAFEEDRLTGFAAYDPERFMIVFTAVLPEKQRRGTGRQMIEFIRDEAAGRHMSRLNVNAPQDVSLFFETCGFEKDGQPVDTGETKIHPMEYLLGREYIGKTVTVIVDRPYGSFHPHNPDVLYPLNYGFIDENTDEDAEFHDAYIYGPEEPLESFKGTVIGMICHKEGPSRFIVGRIGEQFDPKDVMETVAFEEQYYDTRFIWKNLMN